MQNKYLRKIRWVKTEDYVWGEYKRNAELGRKWGRQLTCVILVPDNIRKLGITIFGMIFALPPCSSFFIFFWGGVKIFTCWICFCMNCRRFKFRYCSIILCFPVVSSFICSDDQNLLVSYLQSN